MPPHCTADHVKEQTMNPLLSAISRYFPRTHRNRGHIRNGHRKTRRTRLFLEPLEDRTMPSAMSISNATASEGGADYRFTDNFVAPNGYGLAAGREVEVGPDGNVYVASLGSAEVKIFEGGTGRF